MLGFARDKAYLEDHGTGKQGLQKGIYKGSIRGVLGLREGSWDLVTRDIHMVTTMPMIPYNPN